MTQGDRLLDRRSRVVITRTTPRTRDPPRYCTCPSAVARHANSKRSSSNAPPRAPSHVRPYVRAKKERGTCAVAYARPQDRIVPRMNPEHRVDDGNELEQNCRPLRRAFRRCLCTLSDAFYLSPFTPSSLSPRATDSHSAERWKNSAVGALREKRIGALRSIRSIPDLSLRHAHYSLHRLVVTPHNDPPGILLFPFQSDPARAPHAVART